MKNVLAGISVAAVWLAASHPAAPAGDAAPGHLIYLHGRIVQEEQSARPLHPRYGHYELEKILGALRDRGFIVTGEIREKSASVSGSADRVVAQIRKLLESGVPADRVMVVGASMGASIAYLASARLGNPHVRFSVLGSCLSANVRALVAEEGRGPIGRVLSVREASDDLTGDCQAWEGDGGPGSSLRAREMVIRTGLGHGFIYRPLPEWVDPVVEWAGSR